MVTCDGFGDEMMMGMVGEDDRYGMGFWYFTMGKTRTH